MYNENRTMTLNSRIKNNIYINELLDVEEITTEIENMVVKYLVEKCGDGNFLFESDIQF